MLEKAVELVEIPVRRGQETLRVGLGPLRHARDVGHLEHQLVAEALHAPGHADEVAPLESTRQRIRLLERPGGDRAGAIAQLERQIWRPAAREQTVLARAREDAVDVLPRPERR